MAEKKSTDSISISPEILHTLPMELKHGDPIYCTIPKLGWIKDRIAHNLKHSYQWLVRTVRHTSSFI